MIRPRVLVPVLLLALLAACGKKGSPLEPLRPIPNRIADFTAARIGSRVLVTVTIPDANADATRPADIERIEVYGLTQETDLVDRRRVPTAVELRKHAQLVATIEVRPPPPPAPDPEEEDEGGTNGESAPPKPAPPPDTRPAQGSEVSIVEELTEAVMTPVVLPLPANAPKVVPREEPPAPEPMLPPMPTPVIRAPLIRSYVAIPVSRHRRDGAVSPRAMVPVGVSLLPPPAPTLTHTKNEIDVTWTPAPGSTRRIQEPPEKGDLRSRPVMGQSSVYAYNVYEFSGDADTGSAGVDPLNSRPLESPPYSDSRVEFGQARCYVVRSVYSFTNIRMESDNSAPACITPADTFPPVPPTGLAAVGSQGTISLIWEPNAEPDIGGYLVLRGMAGDETLQPLIEVPIRETTYRDTKVQAGVRYVYAVIAVDNATPPNRSEESNRVEESAR